MKTANPDRSHHMFADRLCVTRCCFAGLVLQAGLVTEHDYSLSPVRLDTGITILRDLTGSRLSRHVITKLIFVIFTFKNNVTRYRQTVNRPSPAHVISPFLCTRYNYSWSAQSSQKRTIRLWLGHVFPSFSFAF